MILFYSLFVPCKIAPSSTVIYNNLHKIGCFLYRGNIGPLTCTEKPPIFEAVVFHSHESRV